MMQFEAGIKSLIRKFRTYPYAFYTETDMHCYLYHRLCSGGLANGHYKDADDHMTMLLHKEYPTASRYLRNTDRTLAESEMGRRRGAFDICVWDPESVSQHNHRKQKILCAAELALNESDRKCTHTINDAAKLSGKANGIKYGYLLYFVRDDRRFTKYEADIRKALKRASQDVRVVLIQVNENTPKAKPEYMGPWAQV